MWYTLSHGILNEVYYPRVDQACIRDLGLIVTAGRGSFSEEKRHARHEIAALAEGVPAYRLTNTCSRSRYRLVKEVLTDPRREVVLQRIRFTAIEGALADYALHALLAPHLGNGGAGNTAWVGTCKGRPMQEEKTAALALWRFNHKCSVIPANRTLRLEVLAPARVRWSVDGWRTWTDSPTRDSGLGIHLLDLPGDRCGPGARIDFTSCWTEADRWEGLDFAVDVSASKPDPGAP